MGVVYSKVRELYLGLRALAGEIKATNEAFNALLSRINRSPGLPISHPTKSYWMQDPLFPDLIKHQSPELPEEADVVIIGSGITGTSIAHTILHRPAAEGEQDKKAALKVVLLEARDICSGATGRNGGHINLTSYEAFAHMEKRFGVEAARKICEFQSGHLQLLLELAQSYSGVSEIRQVETVDFYLDEKSWENAKNEVKLLRQHKGPLWEDLKVWEGDAAEKKFETSHHICGAISHIAGALSPYKLITIILSSLLRDFKSRFFIETNTPVTHITTFENASRRYQVHTPRGTILTNKIIHATNGHGAYLVPGLEGKLIPARAQMSAQYPSEKFEHTQGSRSWCFFGEKSLEYITQRPSTAGELMLGGGFRRTGMDEIGIADDGSLNLIIGAYLGGFLSMVFGNINESTQAGGKLAAMWTGILGITLDVLPFVGPLDEDLTQRKIPESRGSTNPQNRVGEWIAVGYNGEGMVNAWLCGVAVSLMALGLEDEDQDAGPGLPKGKVDDWLPSQYLLTQERLSRASIYDLGELL